MEWDAQARCFAACEEVVMVARRWPAGLARRLTKAGVIGLSLAVFSCWLAWDVPRISPITGSQTDVLPVFLGLRALVAGHDPYADAVGVQAYHLTVGTTGPVSADHAAQFSFHYPLPPALLYLPFALFPSLEAATLVVRALTVWLYLLALLCLARRFAMTARPLALAGLLLWGIAWWPFLAVILPIVQPTGVVVAALVFCFLAAGAGRWFWAGFALFVALLKPQDALPALVVLAIWAALCAEARWRLLAGFFSAAVLPVGLAFIWRPDWLSHWLGALLALPAHVPAYYENPPAALMQALGAAGALVWLGSGALVIAWLALVTWGARPSLMPRLGLVRRWAVRSHAYDPQWGIATGCALALALLPRTGGYELAIGLIPWFYAWQWASELAPSQKRFLARGLLLMFWLGCGLWAYADHGAISGVAFGLLLLGWLLLALGGTSAALPGGEDGRLLQSVRVGVLQEGSHQKR